MPLIIHCISNEIIQLSQCVSKLHYATHFLGCTALKMSCINVKQFLLGLGNLKASREQKFKENIQVYIDIVRNLNLLSSK